MWHCLVPLGRFLAGSSAGCAAQGRILWFFPDSLYHIDNHTLKNCNSADGRFSTAAKRSRFPNGLGARNSDFQRHKRQGPRRRDAEDRGMGTARYSEIDYDVPAPVMNIPIKFVNNALVEILETTPPAAEERASSKHAMSLLVVCICTTEIVHCTATWPSPPSEQRCGID